jgi:hypothetical protein
MDEPNSNEPKAPPRFVGAGERFRAVPLAWPVEHGGKIYAEIGLKRLTAGEVAAFQEAIAKLPDGAAASWPIYRDADGLAVPAEVLDALDDDDKFEIDKAVRDFLPRRFHDALESASGRATGGSTDG